MIIEQRKHAIVLIAGPQPVVGDQAPLAGGHGPHVPGAREKAARGDALFGTAVDLTFRTP